MQYFNGVGWGVSQVKAGSKPNVETGKCTAHNDMTYSCFTVREIIWYSSA